MIKECQQLKQMHRVRDSVADPETTLATMHRIPSFDSFRCELAEAITEQASTLCSILEDTTPNRYNMQCFITSYSIKDELIQQACLSQLSLYIEKFEDERPKDCKSIIEAMLIIFIEALREESDLEMKEVVMSALVVLTNDLYLPCYQNTDILLELCPLLQDVLKTHIDRRDAESVQICNDAFGCMTQLLLYGSRSVQIAAQFLEQNLLEQFNQLWMKKNLCFDFLHDILWICFRALERMFTGAFDDDFIERCGKELYQTLWVGFYGEHDFLAMDYNLGFFREMFAVENNLAIYNLLNSENATTLIWQESIKRHFVQKLEFDIILFKRTMRKYTKEDEIALPVALESLIRKYYMVYDTKWNAGEMTFKLWDRFLNLTSAEYPNWMLLDALVIMDLLIDPDFSSLPVRKQRASVTCKLYDSLKVECHTQEDLKIILEQKTIFKFLKSQYLNASS